MPRKKLTEAIADTASDAAKRKRTAKAKLRVSLGSKFKPLARAESDVTEVIPSGLEVLDRHILGIGGWPVKRVVEIFSDPGGGKTSLLYAALARAQQDGGLAILVETEDAVQVARARVFGCDVDEIYLSEPDTVEGVIEAMREGLAAVPAGVGPNVLGWDSIAMSSPDAVVQKGLDAKTIGKKAALLAQQLPSVVKLCKQKRTAFIIVNQTRTNIGVMFGNPVTTPGGVTPKFAASVRVQLWPGKEMKAGDRQLGILTTVKSMKNRLAIPLKKAKLRLLYEHGWDDHWTTLNFAKDLGVVPKNLKLSEETYKQAREALGWPGEGTPITHELVGGSDGKGKGGPGLVAGDDDDEEGEFR